MTKGGDGFFGGGKGGIEPEDPPEKPGAEAELEEETDEVDAEPQPVRKKRKMPKGGKKRGMGFSISKEQYDGIYEAYCEKQTVDHVIGKTHLAGGTVRKYIKGKADPKKGMPQIHRRWMELQERTLAKADTALATARAKNLKLINLAKSKLVEKLMNSFDSKLISEDRVPSALKDLVMLEERLLGADDIKISMSGGQLMFDGWTVEALEHYINTGKEAKDVKAVTRAPTTDDNG